MVRNSAEMGENLQKIMKRLLSNQNLLKLLYYSDKDPLSQDDLNDDQIREEIFEKLIKVIPRVGPKETEQSLIAIQVNDGKVNPENEEFSNITFSIQVFVPFTAWMIKNENLRPFLIIGEIEKSLKGKTVNGMGKIRYNGYQINFLTEEISCYEMNFSVITYD